MIEKAKAERRLAKGQVLALFALFLIVFTGFSALTIDFGSWLVARRGYQNAADSAVLAGSAFLTRPIDNTKRAQAREAAWASLKSQLGLSAAVNPTSLGASNSTAASYVTDSGYRIWVSTPPIAATTKYPGTYTGATDRYLFAWVEKDNPTFFARIFGQSSATVSAWATAGQFPGRFAVLTLRQNGQDGPSTATDIDLNGSGTNLEVIDGDVGGNWAMKLNSSSQLWLRGIADNESDVYLVDYTTCGSSCWSPNQINSGPNGFPANIQRTPLQLPNILDDPSYPLPPALSGVPLSYGATGAIQKGGGTDAQGDLRIRNGTASGLGCDANSPRIGPGWYHDLRVDSGACLVLDATHTYTDPDNATVASRGKADLPNAQQPGIFYITGTVNVTGGILVGDGVTVVLRPPTASLSPNSGGIIDLNTGASGIPNQKRGAFMTDGNYTYRWNGAIWQYDSSVNSGNFRTGVAIYVVKPAQYGNNTVDANTNTIQVQSGSGLAWSGVTYAPHDNIEIAGQPSHDGIGQFVSWTFKFSGGVAVKQTYDGPDQALPRLVEPHLGQ
jgi:Flp pilus assembly protein TadG